MIVTDDISVLQFWGVPPEFQYIINDDYMTVETDCTDFKIAKTLVISLAIGACAGLSSRALTFDEFLCTGCSS